MIGLNNENLKIYLINYLVTYLPLMGFFFILSFDFSALSVVTMVGKIKLSLVFQPSGAVFVGYSDVCWMVGLFFFF